MYAKSSVLTLPLLNRKIEIDGPDGCEVAYVLTRNDEYLEVIFNPGKGYDEFYAELYFDEYGEDGWKLLRIID